MAATIEAINSIRFEVDRASVERANASRQSCVQRLRVSNFSRGRIRNRSRVNRASVGIDQRCVEGRVYAERHCGPHRANRIGDRCDLLQLSTEGKGVGTLNPRDVVREVLSRRASGTESITDRQTGQTRTEGDVEAPLSLIPELSSTDEVKSRTAAEPTRQLRVAELIDHRAAEARTDTDRQRAAI